METTSSKPSLASTWTPTSERWLNSWLFWGALTWIVGRSVRRGSSRVSLTSPSWSPFGLSMFDGTELGDCSDGSSRDSVANPSSPSLGLSMSGGTGLGGGPGEGLGEAFVGGNEPGMTADTVGEKADGVLCSVLSSAGVSATVRSRLESCLIQTSKKARRPFESSVTNHAFAMLLSQTAPKVTQRRERRPWRRERVPGLQPGR